MSQVAVSVTCTYLPTPCACPGSVDSLTTIRFCALLPVTGRQATSALNPVVPVGRRGVHTLSPGESWSRRLSGARPGLSQCDCDSARRALHTYGFTQAFRVDKPKSGATQPSGRITRPLGAATRGEGVLAAETPAFHF